MPDPVFNPNAPSQDWAPEPVFNPKARSKDLNVPPANAMDAVKQVYPTARPTSSYRGPDHPLSKKNPGSWHAQTGGSLDVEPIPGMSFDQYVQGYKDKGYDILEARDEVSNPSSHATGPHWHVVLGKQDEEKPEAKGLIDPAEGVSSVPVVNDPNIPERETVARFADDATPENGMGPELESVFMGMVNDPNVTAEAAYDWFQKNAPEGYTTSLDQLKANKASGKNTSLDYDPTKMEAPPTPTDGESFLRGVGNPVELLDELGAIVDSLGGTEGRDNVFNSDKRWADLWNENQDQNSAILQKDFDENPISTIGGQILGGLPIPFGNKAKTIPELLGVGAGWGLSGAVAAGEDEGRFDPATMAVTAAAGGVLTAGLGKAFQKLAEKWGGEVVQTPEGAVIDVQGEIRQPTADDVASAWEGPMPEFLKQSASRSRRPEEAPVANPKVAEVQKEVARVQEGWTNKPDTTVVDKLDELPPEVREQVENDGVADDVMGITHNGKVYIFAKNVSGPEDVAAVTYHESLGHYGLGQMFGEKLNSELMKLYKGNAGIRNAVGELKSDYPEDYPLPTLIEEVLAKQSEGGEIDLKFYEKMTVFIRQLARRMGYTGNISDAEVRAIVRQAQKKVVSGTREDGTPGGTKYMVTYHGGPHDFDEFDMKKIGTGEGAQVYGHGLYFTDTKDIAEGYKKRLSSQDFSYQGRAYSDEEMVANSANRLFNADPEVPAEMKKAEGILRVAVKERIKKGGGKITARELLGKIYNQKAIEREGDALLAENPVFNYISTYINNQDLTVSGSTGKLYEVDLPDDARWLDWDKKMSEQPEVIKLLEDKGIFVEEPDQLTGEDFYRKLAGHENQKDPSNPRPDAVASKRLSEAGITGNRYLDGFSRNKGEGGYNYVLFDDKAAKIKNKYMLKDKRKSSPIGAGKAGNINLSHINSTKDIKSFIEDAVKATEGKRISESHDDTMAFAETLLPISGKDTISKLADEMLAIPGKVTAARMLYTTAANRLNTLSTKIAVGGENSDITRQEFLESLIRFNAITEDLANITGAAGRLLSSFNINVKGRNGKAADLRYILKTMPTEVLQSAEGVDRLAAMIHNSGNDPAKAQKIARDSMKKVPEDFFFSLYYNNILSSPETQALNFMGTGVNFGTDLAMRGIAHPTEIMPRLFGALVGVRKSLLADKYMLQAIVKMKKGDLLGSGSKLAQALWQSPVKKAFEAGVPGHKISRAEVSHNIMPGPFKVLETPTRAMAAADEFFRNVILTSDYYGQAMREANKLGYKGKEKAAYIDKLAQNPSSMMINSADEYARMVQFLDDPSGVTKWLEPLRTRKSDDDGLARTGRFVLRVLVPFVRTLDSVTRTILRNAGPLGAFERYNVADKLYDKKMYATRLIVGQMITAAAFMKASDGYITGSGPEDYKKRQELEAGGWQANSIKVGDKWVSLRGLEPISVLLTGPATIKERMEAGELKGDALGGQIKNVLGGFIQIARDNTWMSSMNTIGQMLQDGPMQDRAFDRVVKGFATSLVPMVGFNRTMTQVTDPKIYDTSESLEESIRSVLYPKEGDLAQKHDVYGRPMERHGDVGPDVASRMATKNKETDPVVVELDRLGKTLPGTLVGPVPETIKIDGKQVKLDAKEYQEYQKLSGQYILETIREKIDGGEWEGLDDADKIKSVKEVKEDMRKAAREELFAWEIEG